MFVIFGYPVNYRFSLTPAFHCYNLNKIVKRADKIFVTVWGHYRWLKLQCTNQKLWNIIMEKIWGQGTRNTNGHQSKIDNF